MATGTVTTTIRLDARGFVAGVRAAATSLDALAKKGTKTSQAMITSLDHVAKSVRSSQDEWRTLDDEILKINSSITTVSANWDKFQRSVSSGLQGILGSASALTTHLTRLDAWAGGSPFAHDAWVDAARDISLTSQETHNLISDIGSLQDAASHAGMSATNLQTLITPLTEISASAQNATDTLTLLEVQGIGAVGAVNTAMASVGGQISNSIQTGTTEASATLSGMASLVQQQFGTTAASIAASFARAFTRVKTDWRSLDSSLTSSRSTNSQNSANTTASQKEIVVLQGSFQKLSEPIKSTGDTLGTITNTVISAGTAFATLTPQAASAYDAFKRLSRAEIPVLSTMASNALGAVGHLKDMGTYARQASSSISGFGQNVAAAKAAGSSPLGAMGAAAAPVTKATGGAIKSAGSAMLGAMGGPAGLAATAAITGVTMAIGEFSKRAEQASARADTYAASLNGITKAADQTTSVAKTAATAAVLEGEDFDWGWVQKSNTGSNTFVDALNKGGMTATDFGNAVAGTQAEQEAFLAQYKRNIRESGDAYRNSAGDEIAAKLDQQTRASKEALEQNKQLNDINSALGDSAIGAASATDKHAAALEKEAKAAEDAARKTKAHQDALEALLNWRKSQTDSVFASRTATDNFNETLDNINDQTIERGGGTDSRTETGRQNRSVLSNVVSSTQDVIDKMINAQGADGKFLHTEEEVLAELGRGVQGLTDTYTIAENTADGAAEAAGALAAEARLTPKDIGILFAARTEKAAEEILRFEEMYDSLPDEIQTALKASNVNVADIIEDVKYLLENDVPEETVAAIIGRDDATEVAYAAGEAIRNGIPAEQVAIISGQDNATEIFQSIQSALNRDVPHEKITKIIAENAASGTLDHVQRQLNGLNSKTVTITTEHIQIGSVRSGMTALIEATGGAIQGPGTGTSDSIPAWLSNGEHVLTAAEVRAFGGQSNIYSLRSAIRSGELKRKLGFASGGAIGATVPLSIAVPTIPRPPSIDLSDMRVRGSLDLGDGLTGMMDARIMGWQDASA